MSSNDGLVNTNKCTQMLPVECNSLVQHETQNASGNSPVQQESNISSSCTTNTKKTLQGLLQLSTNLQSSGQDESSLHTINPEMDDERKQFLKEVFASLTVDPADELKKMIVILNETAEGKKDADVENCKLTLEKICDHVCSIDLANLFYQLGGLDSLILLLDHEEKSLRLMAASVVAECCQNNPFCQKLSNKDNLISALIKLGASDPDDTVRFKSLSALSAVIRNNPEGVKLFRKYDGFSMIKDALNSQNERVIKRASFFLSALSDTDETSRGDMFAAGLVPILVNLTKKCDEDYCARALVDIMTNNDPAIKQCIEHGLHLSIGQLCGEPSPAEYFIKAQRLMEPFLNK